jgi:hypothetical protein
LPNDELIGRLEGLREGYAQQLRAANGLLTALKATTGALGKAGRALRDYAEGDTATTATMDKDKLATARQTFDALRLREDAVDPLLPELRRETKALSTLMDALRDAAASLRGEIVDVVKLDRAYTTLQGLGERDDAVAALLPDLNRALQEGQRALGATFGVALRHAMREQGIEIKGQPPRFELGRFDVAADFGKRAASVSYGKELVIKKAPLAVDAIVKAYERAARAVEGRNEDSKRWVADFRTAWELAQRRRDVSGRANIVDCYFELALLRQSKNFRIEPTKGGFAEYSRAQFAYDFQRFGGPRHAYKGEYFVPHDAAKAEAERADKRIWIFNGADSASPHDGRYVGDITYAKE